MAHVFPLGNEKLVISDDLEKYNQLRQEFIPLADEAEKTFKEIYQDENEDFESVLENFPMQVMEALNPVIDTCISRMIDEGIYDVSREAFVEQYCINYISIIERFDEYLTKYNEINGNVDAAREYREYRKATRGMFVGGGFGVSGALKGAATAGAMNMATGLVHSLANGIGNMWDRAVARHTMEAIYNDPLTLCDLANSVWESAFNMHYAYLDVIEERKGAKVARFSMDNIPKARAIYQNIVNLDLPFEKAQKPLCEMFSLQPYEYEFYQYMIMRYGDRDKQLENIGEFFNINMLEMKLVLLNLAISQSLNYKEVDSDLEERLQRIRNIAEHFGIPNDEIVKIEERIRSSYYAYKFSSCLEKKTGLYLPVRDRREKFIEAYEQYKENLRAAIQTEFDKNWDEDSIDGYLIGPDQIQELDSDYEDYLLMYSVNSEMEDFLLKLSDKMLEYGRGRVCRVSQINDIKVENSSLVINNEIWIPFSCEEIDEKLTEELFKNVIKIIQEEDKSEVLSLLNTYSIGTKEQEIIKNIDAYLYESERKNKRIASVYSVFRSDDLEHFMAYYNIVEKIKLQTGKTISETPIILFKNCVTTTMLDESYSDEEYNQSMFRVTGDEYAVFTSENIVFTAKGIIVPISKVKKVYIDDEDGSVYIKHAGEKYTITNLMSEANEYIQEIVEKILAIYGGEKVEKKVISTKPVEVYMADIYAKVLNYAKKRVDKDTREDIFSHVLINCNNQEFDAVCEEYKDRYTYLEDKEILFIAVDDAEDPEYACFVTKEGLCHTYRAKNGAVYCGFSSPNEMISLEYISSFRKVIDEEDGYINKLYLDYFDPEEEDDDEYTTKIYCFNNAYISHSIVTICNMMLNLICEKENIQRKSVSNEGESTPVLDEIKTFVNNMPSIKAEKYVFVLNAYGGKNAPYDWVSNASKYFDNTEKPVVFMYNDALMSPGSKGIVITPKTLYYNIVTDKGSIALKDILEVRDDDGMGTIIETKKGKHVLQYSNPDDMNIKVLTSFIAELVFLLQEKGDNIQKELDILKEKANAERERRSQKGVFNYVQRKAVAKIKNYYDEHSLLSTVAKVYFNDGTKEFEDKFNSVKREFGQYIDNIEVPLIAFHVEGNEKKEGFLLTNERWYHMMCGSTAYNIGLKGIRWAKSEPDLLQTKDIIMLSCSDNDYRVCKVAEYLTRQYIEFLELIIKSYDELSGKIDLSQDEVKEKQKQLNKLVEGYETKSSKELKDMLKTVKEEYPFDFADAVIKKLEGQIQKIEDEELIAKLENKCKEISNMNLTQLDNLKKEISKHPNRIADRFIKEIESAKENLISKIKRELEETINGYETMSLEEIVECHRKVLEYPKDYHTPYIKKLDARIQELYVEKWSEICKELEAYSFDKVSELIKDLQNEKCNEKTKDMFLSKLYERQDALYMEQIDELMAGIESMSIEQLKDLGAKLEEYPQHLSSKSKNKVAAQLDELYRNRIAERSENLESMSLNEVIGLQERLKKDDCTKKIKDEFNALYEKRLQHLYTEQMENWYKEAEDSDYVQAENARQKVVACNAPDDIKKKYINKFTELVKYLYTSRYADVYSFAGSIIKQRNLFDSGLSSYTSVTIKQILETTCPQYNYWEEMIASHHANKLLGYSGYVLTPERFYIYSSNTDAYDIDSIVGFEVVKKFMGSDIVMKTSYGTTINLGSKHGKNMDIVADTLNQILFQLRNCKMNAVTSNKTENQFCVKCGSKLAADVCFCGKCGAPVNQ